MQHYHTPLDLVLSRPVEGPVACARPERLNAAASWFQTHFPGQCLYAVKANPEPWIINRLYKAGLRWFDVASLAEIELISTHCPDSIQAFMHPVKSRNAIRQAYFEHGVRIFTLDCEAELEKILVETAHANDLTLLVRLSVSNEGSNFPLLGKFGANPKTASDLIRKTRAHANELGVCFHVGSQSMRPSTFRTAMMAANRLIVKAGVTVDIVDVGGGFPSIYPGLTPPSMRAYINVIHEAFKSMMVLENAQIWCEPGRALVSEAVSILTRVELVKGNNVYLNDGSYGCLFDMVHAKWVYPMRVHRAQGELSPRSKSFQLFGPTCDTIDTLPGRHTLPTDLSEGDVIEFGMMGAYGTAMASQFNGFGYVETVRVDDHPFPSMYDTSVEEPTDDTSHILAFNRIPSSAKT